MRNKFILFILAVMVFFASFPLVSVFAAAGEPVVLKDSEAEKNFCGEDNRPYQLKDSDVVGTHFSIAGDAVFVGISCPSWSDSNGNLTFSLYKFDTSYEKSVSAEPMIKHEFVDYPDNAFLGFSFPESAPLKAGEYIIEVTDGIDEVGQGVGVWAQQSYAGQHFYEDGEYNADLSLRMSVKLITPLEVPYGPLTANQEQKPSGEIDYMPYFDAMMRFSDDDAESYYSADSSKLQYINNIEINKEGYLSIDVGPGNDPYFYLNLPADADGPTRDDYPVMLIRLKRSEGSPKTGEVFFNTTEFPGPTGGGSLTMQYADTTDWQNVIVNLGSNKNFTGTLIDLRYDIVPEADQEYNYLIDYILFFSSKEAAAAFKHEDLETLLAQRPTPAPATPTVTPTDAPTKAPGTATAKTTAKATASASNTKGDEGLSTGEILAIVICAVVVVGGVVAIIIILNRKKKNDTDATGGSKKE